MPKDERASSSSITADLEGMIAALHPAIFLSRLVPALSESRSEYDAALLRWAGQGGADTGKDHSADQYQACAILARRVRALELLTDLALATNSCGPFVCRSHELRALLERTHTLLDSLESEGVVGVSGSLGPLKRQYEHAIRHHIQDSIFVRPSGPGDATQAFEKVYSDNCEYLASVFPRRFGFTWEAYVEGLTRMVSKFFHAPGFVSTDSLERLIASSDSSRIIRQLTYSSKEARRFLDAQLKCRNAVPPRGLFEHPLPCIDRNTIVSAGLLCSSFNHVVENTRRLSSAFLKAKGHVFEQQLITQFEELGWTIREANLLVMEEIVPGETRAEFDVLAQREHLVVVVEAKAYAPANGRPSRRASTRRRQGREFSEKLRIKAQYVASNLAVFGLNPGIVKGVIPILVSTFPFVDEEVCAGVLQADPSNLSTVLSSPEHGNSVYIVPLSAGG